LFFAGETTEISVDNGTVYGAIASGYRAAQEINEARPPSAVPSLIADVKIDAFTDFSMSSGFL
jgi:hypothetical protein